MADYYTKEETDNLVAELKQLIHNTELKTQYSIQNEIIARRLGDKLMQDQLDNMLTIQKIETKFQEKQQDDYTSEFRQNI